MGFAGQIKNRGRAPSINGIRSSDTRRTKWQKKNNSRRFAFYRVVRVECAH